MGSKELNQSMHGFAAEAVYSQGEAGFVAGGGIPALECSYCENWDSASLSCAVVQGTIKSDDVCNFFEPASHLGGMPALFGQSKSFDMYITKASQDPESGEMRWAAVASDTDKDSYGDQMSLELYSDFNERIKSDEVAPAVFTSSAWQGGMPYLGLAHYLDLDGDGIVGDPNAIYVDGNRLKSKGIFRGTPLGEAAFAAVKSDQKNDIDYDERIRISIAFVDWAHDHVGDDGTLKSFTRRSLEDSCPICAVGAGNKIYRRGQLVHLALTRVPVNERTPIWLEERAMPKTMKEDALSVLGEDAEEIVEDMDTKARKKKTERIYKSEAVVVKSEEGAEEEQPKEDEVLVEGAELEEKSFGPYGGATSFDDAEDHLKQSEELDEVFNAFSMLDGILYNIQFDDEVKDKPEAMSSAVSDFKARVDSSVKRSLAVRAAHLILEAESKEGETMTKDVVDQVVEEAVVETAEAPASVLDTALEAFKSMVEEVSADTSVPIEERLAKLQPSLNQLAEVTRTAVKGEQVISAEVIASAVAGEVGKQLEPVVEALQLLAAKSATPVVRSEEPTIPGPRAFAPHPAYMAEEDKPKSPITSMIRKSVGLKD
jgi:hypothetical protein